ncbi:MAG TPA: ergothioneine biosynthesis protein EgtC [Stackebrandtia sp.]|jgi:glutamine amidotransferase|uniref:ergothioneine biosynthesis protein EgtC n=1 Tax=Stackebrandtia sp. TaxID=2023065 RepID=UPI002D39E711|nr:ergothioneine biosynthesis protein EgtC [Stackebrandtia sp.]HZE40971.1 ergothioneine biosynthesis protein EgtC [Stackebrandtia sp.]
MCRHVAHVGDPIPLSRLLFEPPHSLSHQAWAPEDMRQGGTINVDGFGVGWYVGRRALRYRRAIPLWNDADLPAIAETISSPAILAAIRSASQGMAAVDTACAPFTDGTWLCSLNGRVGGWPGTVARLAAALPTATLLTLDAQCDAAFVWALLRHRLDTLDDPAEAVRSCVTDIAAAAPDSRLNVLLTDGERIIATTWWHALSVRHTDGGVTVASEPLDASPAWRSIGDRQLVLADRHRIDIRPLETS